MLSRPSRNLMHPMLLHLTNMQNTPCKVTRATRCVYPVPPPGAVGVDQVCDLQLVAVSCCGNEPLFPGVAAVAHLHMGLSKQAIHGHAVHTKTGTKTGLSTR